MMSELLLLSGGIDSIAIAAERTPHLCLTIDYGQAPARGEIQSAAQVCSALQLSHKVVRLNGEHLGSGLMATGAPSPLSTYPEFWPYRNQLLITIGAIVALHERCNCILIGTVLTDRRHKDGAPAFLRLASQLLSIQEGGLRLEAPGMDVDSVSLVRRSGVKDAVLGWAHSCHVSDIACGVCPGCNKHRDVMTALGWDQQ